MRTRTSMDAQSTLAFLTARWQASGGPRRRHPRAEAPASPRRSENSPGGSVRLSGRESLLLRVLGGAGSPAGMQLTEAAGDRFRDERVDVAAVRRDLLHTARRDERHARAGHHVHGL